MYRVRMRYNSFDLYDLDRYQRHIGDMPIVNRVIDTYPSHNRYMMMSRVKPHDDRVSMKYMRYYHSMMHRNRPDIDHISLELNLFEKYQHHMVYMMIDHSPVDTYHVDNRYIVSMKYHSHTYQLRIHYIQ
jgi:hypothetical protein